MDTYSANSLKILNNSKEEYQKRYIEKNELIKPETKEQILGNKFHSLICYYLKNFEIKKFENSLSENELKIFERIKKSNPVSIFLKSDEKHVEQPFFVIEKGGIDFCLTGRFDAVCKIKDKYIILDWKTKNLPKDIDYDIQTMVYTECCSKLYKTKNVEMIYYSLFEDKEEKAFFREEYIEKIKKIIEL